MPAASGIFKNLAYKVETTFGVLPGASGAQLLRRTSSDLALTKDTFSSAEIRTDLNDSDYRHGVRRVAGSVAGELSPGTYKDFFGAALKRDFAAVAPITAVSLTIAGTGPSWTITRAAGDFLAGGIKVGHVIQLSVGVLNALNLGKNLLVTAATATVLTVIVLNGSALFAQGPVTGCTVSLPGKATFLPTSGHTDRSFTFEHAFLDVAQSEQFTGCKVSKLGLSLPPTGMATLAMDIMGKGFASSTAAYFTTPAALTATPTLAAVNGVVRVGGVTMASITGLTLDISPMFSGDPVVGSNTVPNMFPGKVRVTGQFTAYFEDAVLRDVFVDETEIDLALAFTADNTPGAQFIAITLPRVKVGGASKSDGEGGIVATFPFVALLNNAGGPAAATEKTTIQVQDSAA